MHDYYIYIIVLHAFVRALMYNYYIYIIVLVHDMIFSSYRFYLDMICDQDLAKRVRSLQRNLIADLLPFLEEKTARNELNLYEV